MFHALCFLFILEVGLDTLVKLEWSVLSMGHITRMFVSYKVHYQVSCSPSLDTVIIRSHSKGGDRVLAERFGALMSMLSYGLMKMIILLSFVGRELWRPLRNLRASCRFVSTNMGINPLIVACKLLCG